MIDLLSLFNRVFGRQSSGATAKERLRLVLMSDHLSLAPEMVEAMKSDLVDVISRYVEVDRDRIDVHFEHQEKALAMMANIPITGVNRNPPPAPPPKPPAAPRNGTGTRSRKRRKKAAAAPAASAPAT
jgi:cell division topological specificity factor